MEISAARLGRAPDRLWGRFPARSFLPPLDPVRTVPEQVGQPGGNRPAFLPDSHPHRHPASPAGQRCSRVERRSGASCYWRHREPPGPAPETMIHQY